MVSAATAMTRVFISPSSICTTQRALVVDHGRAAATGVAFGPVWTEATKTGRLRIVMINPLTDRYELFCRIKNFKSARQVTVMCTHYIYCA
jgi:hypothetical protein